MTVLLVLFTFVTFLLIDQLYSKRRNVVQPAVQMSKRATPHLAPSLVAGFEVRDKLRYHPGHTWALGEGPLMVRVGMDDFASKLTGKIESITLPQRGQWIRQGQKLATLHRDGIAVDMISPIEGSVSDVNDTLLQNPALAQKDPYGEGWMITVQSPDAKINFRNLLNGAVARSWMEESASRLRTKLPSFAAMMPASALAQDGGVAIDNVASQISDNEWAAVTREFFLS